MGDLKKVSPGESRIEKIKRCLIVIREIQLKKG